MSILRSVLVTEPRASASGLAQCNTRASEIVLGSILCDVVDAPDLDTLSVDAIHGDTSGSANVWRVPQSKDALINLAQVAF